MTWLSNTNVQSDSQGILHVWAGLGLSVYSVNVLVVVDLLVGGRATFIFTTINLWSVQQSEPHIKCVILASLLKNVVNKLPTVGAWPHPYRTILLVVGR